MPRSACRRVCSVNRVEATKLLIEAWEETDNLSETAGQWQTSGQAERGPSGRRRGL